ncbi:MAG: hypothetical protein AB8I08_30530, partial [Sandaracinaceae bacterium]
MPEPLREHLDSPTDEARISRMWEAVRRGRTERRRTPSARLATAGVIAAAAVAAAAWVAWPGAPTEPFDT